MKAKFLKIAGVKSEQEFYKKYPTEAAFFKAHPEAKKQIKKAQTGINQCGPGQYWSDADQMCVDYDPSQSERKVGRAYQTINQISGPATPGGMPSLGWATSSQLSGTPYTGPTGVGMSDPNSVIQLLPQYQGPKLPSAGKQKTDIFGKIAPYAGAIGEVIGGINALSQEKKALDAARQAKMVSDVALQASSTMPEQMQRRYVRPENMVTNPNQLYTSYGTGTNVLAKDGILLNKVGGTVTEIQNKYSYPDDIYTDLGYEPLDESGKVKQFQDGGFMNFFGDFSKSGGGDVLTGIFDQTRGPNAGASIGKTAGKTLGTVFGGPVGGLIGGVLGNVVGGFLDDNPRKIKRYQEQTQRNVENMATQNQIKNLTSGYSQFVRDGGNIPHQDSEYEWISHTWQPQVITHFGEHKMSDLLKEDETMDTLRTGGNLRQNVMFPQDMMALGGELQTTWGGYAQPISQNPYLPGTGQTIMFRGQSHDESDGKGRTGIGVKYGNDGMMPYMEYGKDGVEDVTDVEVERNEPATELPDENGEKNLVVYGNLQIPNYALSAIGDPKAKGKKFKSYVADLSKEENKQNKLVEKTSNELADFQPITSMDKLKWESLTANLQGANTKLAQIATFKQNAAAVQNAINETAKEQGLSAEHLAKGLTKFEAPDGSQARNGKKIEKAQTETDKPSKTYAMKDVPKGQHKSKIYYGKVTDADFEQLKKNNPWYDWRKFNPAKKGDVKKFQERFNELSKLVGSDARLKEDDLLGEQTASARVEYPTTAPTPATVQTTTPQTTKAVPRLPEETAPTKSSLKDMLSIISSAIPRRPYQEGLDYAQLYPEMFAMATNQLEPVQAQLYRPQLKTPYDISLQDIMNQNQADFNAMQRMTGYNPAATAALASQKYAANEKVLGEQFRQNQAMRMGIANENINTLNDAQLKNLQILDNQYVRQAQAKSNTKATTLSALSSIADKVAKNKLENRTFAAYSNMFPQYGFRGDMTMFSQAPTFFTISDVGSTKSTTDTKEKSSTAKQGTKLKKDALKNSMFVKSLKRI